MGMYLINGKYDNKNYIKIDWVIENFSDFVLNDDNIIKAINEAKKDNKYLKDLTLKQAKKYLLLEDDVNSYEKLVNIFKNLIFATNKNEINL